MSQRRADDVTRPEDLVDLARLSRRFDDYEVSHGTLASVNRPGLHASAGRTFRKQAGAAAEEAKTRVCTDTCKSYIFALISCFPLADPIPWIGSRDPIL